jgi:hypothetical protein
MQTSYTPTYRWVKGPLSPGVKWPRHEADPPLHLVPRLGMSAAPHKYPHGAHGDNFTFSAAQTATTQLTRSC